jgi:hypothetical protein
MLLKMVEGYILLQTQYILIHLAVFSWKIKPIREAACFYRAMLHIAIHLTVYLEIIMPLQMEEL